MMLFNEKVLEVALSQIGLNIGWQSMSQQSMRILQTLVIKYIQEIGKTTMSFANNFNRSEALFDDLLLALRQMNINIEEVQEYMREVDCVPFVKGNNIPLYPCPPPKGYLRINFPGPEEIASRPEYMEEWLPSMNFGEKSDDKEKTKALTNGQLGQDASKEGELRPDLETLERKDGLKGERMNDHIYLSSVYIDAEGRVVGIGGREGVAPDSRLLPKDDYEEVRKAEEEEKARKRKKEEEENEKKKKQKLDENKPKVPKIKLKDKGFIRGRKGDLMKKKMNPLARKENMKKKTSLSIKVSGLASGTPTAKPSPSLVPRSPLEFPSKDDDDRDLALRNSQETSKINEDYDNIINSVVERSRIENDLEPGDDDDHDDRDFTLKVVDDVPTPKQKKIKKKVVRNKVKKKTSYDQTIDDVIKTAMDNTNDINDDDDEEKSDKSNVYTFSEENNFDVKVKEETGVDAKEAAKILVSLSEDASKKPKKINSKRTSKAPSPSPFGPPVSTFSEVRGSSQVFPKVSPGSTPMSPNSNTTMFNPFTSPLKSPPQSPIPTPPLFSSKSDFYQIGPHTSPIFNSNVMSPSHSTPVPLPKPPLKTLAEKKALPPINENLLLKKEKREKKKKEKGKDKNKEKDKERDQVKEKEKHKDFEREDKKHDVKESKKTKKLKKTHEVEPRIEKKVDSFKNNSKVSLKTVNCHSPLRDIPSPASSTSSSSSTKLVIRTPPPTEQSKEKRDGKKKKRRNNSASIEEPARSVKQNVKEKARDKSKIKEEKKSKDRSKEKDTDASCVLITETITKEARGKQENEWICPSCRVPYDGVKEMIGCDECDDWYHWTCVNIHKDPGEEESWFCPPCIQRQKAIETKVIKKSLSLVSSKSNRKDWTCPICRDLNPKGESDPMIECDKCDEWYHYSCVNILCEPSQDEPWFCPTCKPSKRSSGSKKRTKQSKGSSKSSKSEKGEQKDSGKNSSSGWSCLVCNKSNNSKPTICCDSCDQWFHFPCVGIVIPPKPEASWYCEICRKKPDLM